MTSSGHRPGLMRHKSAGGHHRVTFVELFFDLIFVFAVTQIAHSLAGHYTPGGAAQALFLLLAVWWVWVYTSWATNWLDPDHVGVRLLLFAMMFAGLVMSASIPVAFAGGGLAFALAFSFMQVARGVFIAYAIPANDRALKRNFIRIMIWLMASAVFWIAGGLADGALRVALWMAALGIEVAGPWARFWTPRMGASSVDDWSVDGAHMAERCGLFVIIALGESILVTGANFSKMPSTPLVVAAFVVAFTGSLAMWWVYFDQGAEAGSQQISQSSDPGRLARLAYTYMHLPIVGGIVLSAVADELLLAHPESVATYGTALSILGGPALFLAGVVSFKWCIRGWFQPSHLTGLAAFAAIAPFSVLMSHLALAAAAGSVLVGVAIWERISLGSASQE